MDDDPRRRPARPLLSLTVFLVLLVLVAVGTLDHVDAAVRDVVDDHRRHLLTEAARYLTDVLSPGVDAMVLGIGSLWVAHRRRRRLPLVVAAVSGGATAAVVLVVKAAVGRSGSDLYAPGAHGRSFPSGHTAAALVCLGLVVLLATAPGSALRRRWLLAVAGLTTAVAAALVYADYHWLSDTVASAALGIAVLDASRGWINRHAPPVGPAAARSARTRPKV